MKINQRLFDHYGIDITKDLGIRKNCPRPWDTVLIDKQGSCYACECQSWLPQSIGNLQVKPLDQIIDSTMHRQLKSSIEDSSYRYCNSSRCSYLTNRDYRHFDLDSLAKHIVNVRLAIDDSCNLRCPSCRDRLIFHKQGPGYERGIRLADRINEWLANVRHPVQVHMGSDGDPFASQVYRYFMEHVPDRDSITFSIMTNGLMFCEYHTRIPRVLARLHQLEVSIDGVTQDTYEHLRLGGRWQALLKNLRRMGEKKQEHGFQWNWHMVVQEQNWREMPAMLKMAQAHGVDKMYFNRIRDWGTSLDVSSQRFHELEEFRTMRHDLARHKIAITAGLL